MRPSKPDIACISIAIVHVLQPLCGLTNAVGHSTVVTGLRRLVGPSARAPLRLGVCQLVPGLPRPATLCDLGHASWPEHQ